MSQTRVLILGGGFAGVKAALLLSADSRFRVSVVSDHPDFRYYPALYRSATGGTRKISAIPLSEVFAGHPVEIIRGKATSLDRSKKTVHTKGAGTLPYDILIVALGMTTNYFGINGLEQYSYGIKSIEEAEELKKHLHQQMITDRRPDLHYLIVGAGPTGVEVAGALPAYLKRIMQQHNLPARRLHIELIEAAPRVLPRMPKDVSRATARRLKSLGVHVYTNQKVQAETADNLVVNGKPIKSHTVIWTAGVTCNPFLKDNGFALSDHGRAEVDQHLQAEPDIFVLGDNAETLYTGVAQTALYDAVFVANNLMRHVSGKTMQAYTAKRPIYVTPTGSRWASVVWGTVHIFGWLGWMLRRAADLIGYHDYEPWWSASKLWVAEKTEEDICPLCNKT